MRNPGNTKGQQVEFIKKLIEQEKHEKVPAERWVSYTSISMWKFLFFRISREKKKKGKTT